MLIANCLFVLELDAIISKKCLSSLIYLLILKILALVIILKNKQLLALKVEEQLFMLEILP